MICGFKPRVSLRLVQPSITVSV